MDFRLSPSAEQFRDEVREFLAQNLPPEVKEEVYRSGVSHHPAFTKALAERGWIAPHWPVDEGGQGRDAMEIAVLNDELRLADAPTYGIGTTVMVANVIRAAGTDEQKAELLPKVLAGDVIMVLGFTEPESGSDVAAAKTKAVRDGDGWLVTGQKMFTTNAQVADYAFVLARTNPDVPKHKGLTMFLVPMDQPGVEVQAVYTVSGERTNITYYNDARVPDSLRLGPVDEGWATLNVALADEHASGFAPALARLLRAAEEWAATGVDEETGRPPIENPAVREALGRTAADLEVARLLQRRALWMGAEGLPTRAEGPMYKLFSSESLGERAQELVELMGPDGLRSYFDPTAPANGVVEHVLRFSLGTTIYAGTSEIHRNLIAQRGLGLPRPK